MHLGNFSLINIRRLSELDKEKFIRLVMATKLHSSSSYTLILILLCSENTLDVILQFHYNDWLEAQCGCPTSEDWRVQMFYANRENRRVRRDSYRDE